MRSAPILLALLALSSLAPRARAATVPTGFIDSLVVGGLDHPAAIEFLPDGRLLFTEQFTGLVRLVVNGAIAPVDPVLVVPDLRSGGEQGLLGIAVDPQFPARPYIYLHQSLQSLQHISVARFTLTGDLAFTGDGRLLADPASRFDVIDDISDQSPRHNGGTLQFGPDGMLYASMGEDGIYCRAQERTWLQGVILRLDVRGLPAGPGSAFRAQVTPADNPFVADPDSNARLVGAYGLRNPFRFQVDPVRRWLLIGDVGEIAREELDALRLPGGTTGSGSAALGANFGWPQLEGTRTGTLTGCPAPTGTLVAPIFEYDRTSQGLAAIISAGAYHAPAGGVANWPAAYAGDVFVSDYYSGTLSRVHDTAGTWSLAAPVSGQPSSTRWGTGFDEVSDWRVGPDGSLWYCRQSVDYSDLPLGSIRQVAYVGGEPPPPPPPPDSTLSSRFWPYPVPGNGAITLSFSLGIPTQVYLTIHDAKGALVRTLERGSQVGAGTYYPVWDGHDDDGHDVRSGLYFARLQAGGIRVTRVIPLIR